MLHSGIGKGSYCPSIYEASSMNKSKKENDTALWSRDASDISSPTSTSPAIDGPSSIESLRAYTGDMKNHLSFSPLNSSTSTLLSGTSSLRSPASYCASTDHRGHKQSFSSASGVSMMARSESSLGLSSIFSRNSKKQRRELNVDREVRSSSPAVSINTCMKASAREQYYGLTQRMKHAISEPYNFQHITHTRQEHIPTLVRKSHHELVTEFATIRATETTPGALQGIKTRDLNFENFPSEALLNACQKAPASTSPTGFRPRAVLRKARLSQKLISHTKSHDSLRAPPPRPPRPSSSDLPMTFIPIRISSRASHVEPAQNTLAQRPQSAIPFDVSTRQSDLPILKTSRTQNSTPTVSHSSLKSAESWPLQNSPCCGNFSELTDVREEEEDSSARNQCVLLPGNEKSLSKHRPQFIKTHHRGSTILAQPGRIRIFPRTPLSPGFPSPNESWESAIDWCYENEVEAHCDFKWVEEESRKETPTTPVPGQQSLHLRIQNNEHTYRGYFRHSLLVPKSPCSDVPALSPMSDTSIRSPGPPTPSMFLRPPHPQRVESLKVKDSIDFGLSPALPSPGMVIPDDFKTPMEENSLYHENFAHDTTSVTFFDHQPYNPSVSSIEEGELSTASIGSSDYNSYGSQRSSSSTRISGLASHGSQDSTALFNYISCLSQSHHSLDSASSLPDLVPSNQSENQLTNRLNGLKIADEIPEQTALPSLHCCDQSSTPHDSGSRVTVSSSTLSTSHSEQANSPALSCASPPDKLSRSAVHERNISAPILGPSTRDFKRHKCTTSMVVPKRSSSYSLFPRA